MNTVDLELARSKKRLEESLRQVEEDLRQLEKPVNFDQLCRDGVLERTGAKTLKIPDRERLPDHVAVRLQVTETTTTTKKGAVSRSVTECTGKLRNEAALKKELLRNKKMLEKLLALTSIHLRFFSTVPHLSR
jgi:hypothetical protein